MKNKKIIINLTEDWFFVSHFLGRAVEQENLATRYIFLVMRLIKENLLKIIRLNFFFGSR